MSYYYHVSLEGFEPCVEKANSALRNGQKI